MESSIGETLREARHNRKTSLEEAARATKIKIEILEQLEADEFNRLAAPTYTKGFLKLYAEYLGLDGQAIADHYLRSQGGLRRKGLRVETEASVRARKPSELQLRLGSVVLVVVALTVVALAVLGIKSWWSHRKSRAAPVAAAAAGSVQPVPAAPKAASAAPLPRADFDAYYRPKSKPVAELLELPSSK